METKLVKLIEYGTGRVLAEVKANELNKWCSANRYLPHHKCGRGWVLVKC